MIYRRTRDLRAPTGPRRRALLPCGTSYTTEYPPDYQSASLWLRNRRKQDWRDRHEIEAKIDDESLLDRYAEEQLITRLMQRREQRRSDGVEPPPEEHDMGGFDDFGEEI